MSNGSRCKYCGTELSDFGEFCTWTCRQEYKDTLADYEREFEQSLSDRELNNLWEPKGFDEDIHFNLTEAEDDIPY